MVGTVVGRDASEGFAELDERHRKGPFVRLVQGDRSTTGAQRFQVDVALGENAAHTGVAVLHVSGGVAVHGQHFVVAKDVVAGAIMSEVGVFDRADADSLGDLMALVGVEQRLVAGVVVGADDFMGALDGFVEQAGQADGAAGASFVGLAVLAEYGAEADVLEFDVLQLRMLLRPEANRGEQLLEVE